MHRTGYHGGLRYYIMEITFCESFKCLLLRREEEGREMGRDVSVVQTAKVVICFISIDWTACGRRVSSKCVGFVRIVPLKLITGS